MENTIYLFVMIVLNLIVSFITFELLLRVFKGVRSRVNFFISRVIILIFCIGLFVLLNQSIKLFIPNITNSELKYSALIWILSMLVYLHRYFTPKVLIFIDKNKE